MSREVERESAATLGAALGFTETVVEVGHTHPGVRRVLEAAGGTIGFLVSLDDEQITELEVEIGIGHRGFEKEVESVAWHRALPYVGRLGYATGAMAQVAYCLAVEGLAGRASPERATWLRMLASEVARATDHFTRLGAVAASIGLPAAERVAHQGEAQGAALLRHVTGVGPLDGWVCLGGVASALPADFDERWTASRAALESTLALFESTAVENPTCQHRLRDVAVFSAEQCFAWSVSGPSLRAAGLPLDLRRDAPYLAYAEVDFDVPIGENGDDFDRLLVVVEEIRQSLRIVDQCRTALERIGNGALRIAEPGWRDPVGLDFEAHSRAVLDGPSIPAGEFAQAIESSTGEFGFFVVSDGEGLPRRIHCRAPSFLHAQALPAMLRGAQLDDLLPTAALLHLVSGECDR